MVRPIISVERLRIIYNQGKSNEIRALEETNLKIFPKEYIVIFGPSGCGKSTLLYSIAGLQKATYGDVSIEGKPVSRMSASEELELHRTGVGMIFQAFYLIPSLTVLDNVCLPKIFRGESPGKRRLEGIRLLRRFGIAEQADKFPSQLSGGQKQRVAIARSLINNPQIILADEPVGNLDSESAQNVLEILKELNGVDQKTIVMVTHNPEHLAYADRVIRMKDGMVVSEEVRTEKRPEGKARWEVKAPALAYDTTEVSSELKMLSHSFKNLSAQQTNILLVPFKAKQLLNHILSELTDEQTSMAEALLKEVLFENLKVRELKKRLDLELDKGGAGWNRKKAASFSEKVERILEQVRVLRSEPDKAPLSLSRHLVETFGLRLNEEQELRLQSALRFRIENKINPFELRHRLDAPRKLGGVGLYKNTAEKIVRETEVVLLLKYS
jgi:putative ABC transport system ATP-binding protein